MQKKQIFVGLLMLVTVGLLTGCGGAAATETVAPEDVPVVASGADVDCFVIVDAEPDLGAPPLHVLFETEVDCTSRPVSYRWDFGDGASGGNEPNPTHVYQKEGDFLATVTVTAPDGAVGTDEIDITVDEMLGDD